MSISRKLQNNKNNSGFTLVELVVVIAGLSALSAIAIPGILNQIKLSKIESVKATMNAYAAECLGKYRTSTNPSKDYVNKVEPSFDTDLLDNLGYKIDGDNKTCTSFGIKPIDDKETFSYGMNFEVIGGNVVKTGTPYGDSPPESALKSCKNWAGQNCGMTDEQKAKLAEARALQKKKDDCEADYLDWSQKAKLANSDEKGNGRSWSLKDKDCNIEWWAYGGKIGPDKTWYEKQVEEAIGKKCNQSRLDRILENKLTDELNNPNGETIDHCDDKFWFTLDQSFTVKSLWDKQVQEDALNLCNADLDTQKKNDYTGVHLVKPKLGPLPCGTTVYFCKGAIEPSKAGWEAGECGQEEKQRKEEEARKAAAEAAAKKAAEQKKLEDKDIPKEVKGRLPGSKIQCKTPMPNECNSPKWRKLIPDCKCWYPNG